MLTQPASMPIMTMIKCVDASRQETTFQIRPRANMSACSSGTNN